VTIEYVVYNHTLLFPDTFSLAVPALTGGTLT